MELSQRRAASASVLTLKMTLRVIICANWPGMKLEKSNIDRLRAFTSGRGHLLILLHLSPTSQLRIATQISLEQTPPNNMQSGPMIFPGMKP